MSEKLSINQMDETLKSKLEEIYQNISLKHLGNNPQGTRMDIIYDSMLEAIKKLGIPDTELKYMCTRFAHECRLKGALTNNDTCNLFDVWIKDVSYQHKFIEQFAKTESHHIILMSSEIASLKEQLNKAKEALKYADNKLHIIINTKSKINTFVDAEKASFKIKETIKSL